MPAVGDEIVQMLVKRFIEPELDQAFLSGSYSHRLRKSALDAVDVTRKRCWRYDWVFEFDTTGLFDNIPRDLSLKAVRCDVRMGAARDQEMADNTHEARWEEDRANARYPARGRNEANSFKSVHALRIRSLDETDMPGPPTTAPVFG